MKKPIKNEIKFIFKKVLRGVRFEPLSSLIFRNLILGIFSVWMDKPKTFIQTIKK